MVSETSDRLQGLYDRLNARLAGNRDWDLGRELGGNIRGVLMAAEELGVPIKVSNWEDENWLFEYRSGGE